MVPLLLLCTGVAFAAPAIQIPLSFEPNRGQTDASVRYLAHGRNSTMWFTRDGAVLGISKKNGTALVRMQFEGGNKSPEIVGEDPTGAASNYFIGRDPAKWRTGVPRFAKVRYRQVYPGIDVVFHSEGRDIEYDFDVAPGADPSRIRLAFGGANRLRERDGDLIMNVAGVEVRHHRPAIYQNGRRIEGHFALRGKNRAGFVIDAYDAAKPLVIDPVLTYATYLGGSEGEEANAAAIDAQGDMIVVGYTTSTNFPAHDPLYTYTSNPNNFTNPPADAFVAKFSSTGSIVFATFYGGTWGTYANAVTTDKSGNIYVAGQTGTGDLPLKNAFQSTFTDDLDCGTSTDTTLQIICDDAFLAEFNPTGSALLLSSYLGGSGWDQANGIALDGSGNIYLAGYTGSLGFPIRGQAYQTSLHGTQNPFIAQVSPAGQLVYSSYFGPDQTSFSAVSSDASGNVYLTGTTYSNQLPVTPGALESTLVAPRAALAMKLNLTQPGAEAIEYCTYFGGLTSGAGSAGNAVANDSSGNIYIAGGTNSSQLQVSTDGYETTIPGVGPVLGPFAAQYVAKLNPAGSGNAQLIYSTYLGGSFDNWAVGVSVDSSGRITVLGNTDSYDFPVTQDAFQCCYTGELAPGFATTYFTISRFDPTKSGSASLLYSTLVGGTFYNEAYGLAMDSTGNTVAAVGYTRSIDAPVTANAYQPKFGGEVVGGTALVEDSGDAYIAKFDFSTSGPVLTNFQNGAGLAAISPPTVSPGLIFTVKGTALGPTTSSGAEIDPSTGLVASTVDGVQVLVNGVPAPLIYVSATQINAIAPYEIASQVGNNVPVQVVYNGIAGTVLSVPVAATAPAIFSFGNGAGQGAILNQDQSINGANNPASAGTIISIYATGEGQTQPAGVDGALATEAVGGIPTPAAKSSVTIGGVNAPIQYIGTAPGGVAGFLQVNVTVPAGVTPGSAVPVVLTVGGVASQKGLTMAVQ